MNTLKLTARACVDLFVCHHSGCIFCRADLKRVGFFHSCNIVDSPCLSFILIPEAGANRKDKSLRIMSQKFVMLFLVSKTQIVTLDAAARTLIDESQDLSSHSKYKSE